MKGILMLFEEQADAFERDTENFNNPKTAEIEAIIEGKPNQLYAQGLYAYL